MRDFSRLDHSFAATFKARRPSRDWLVAWVLYGITAGTISGVIQVVIR